MRITSLMRTTLLVLTSGWSSAFAVEPESLSEKDYRSAWHKLTVPGTWDDQSNGVLSKFDGIAWYRAEAKIPAEWQSTQVTIATEQIDNAHEAYFNGVKLGGAGAFPPKYESGLKELKKYVVPSEHIRYGEANVIAIRVYDHDGKGGFKGAAPSVSAGGQTIRMEGKWDFRLGDDAVFAARVDDKNAAKLPTTPA